MLSSYLLNLDSTGLHLCSFPRLNVSSVVLEAYVVLSLLPLQVDGGNVLTVVYLFVCSSLCLLFVNSVYKEYGQIFSKFGGK